MTWKCSSCGNEMDVEDFKEFLGDLENSNFKPDGVALEGYGFTSIEDASEVILLDCPDCPDKLATYKKNTIDSDQESSNTTTRSKMLQAARS